ncbi:mannosyltransferase APTG1 isoform X1 [Cryptomeria japonica]|uniref:mannosyltransferase APTG1 isoform X1 n=1 Tax=Cryptomeria japonica TaxID=3369 RepID=UPI0027D9EFE5|nr:mannosyltransferase APTG1 isoform X1 [Cryptomeria japonica]
MRQRSISGKNGTSDPSLNFKSGSEIQKQVRSGNGNNHFWTERNIFIGCLGFRIINALLVQTYFNPDEHWQALEVAHRIVFGYGHLTWEWEKGIRSYLHPLIFALLYKILAIFQLDTVWFMIKTPRLLQSLFAAIGDIYLYKLADRCFGKHVSQWALFCQMTNWFMFFCITRTLSNSLETVLTIVSLFYWPFYTSLPGEAHYSPMSRKIALFVAAICCAIRPTSAVLWFYLGIIHLYKAHDKTKFLFFELIPIGAIVLVTTCLLDRWMYGTWILVPLNFLKFNFLSAGGDYYGTHPWHWYFTQGFPAMAFTFLPLSVAGIWLSKEWQLAGLIGWVLGLYSVLGHKEFRFVLPVLPITMMFSGYSLAELDKHSFPSQQKMGKLNETKKWSWKFYVIFILLITNIPTALYMSLVHQRGSEAVMIFLAKEADKGHVQSVTFLMPCHATPYYASVHKNLTMRFLDCTPSDVGSSTEQIMDESDCFIRDPLGFASNMLDSLPLPSHLVLFDAQEVQLRDILALHGYIKAQKYFHSHFRVDRELQGYVVVYIQHQTV